jgi:hypothetical protein
MQDALVVGTLTNESVIQTEYRSAKDVVAARLRPDSS